MRMALSIWRPCGVRSPRGGRALVSLMLANNETGVVQPVSEAARLVHEAGGLAACRCRPGGWPDLLRYQRAWGGFHDAFRPQARRSQGCRRADQALGIPAPRRRSSKAAARSAAPAPAPRMSQLSPASARLADAQTLRRTAQAGRLRRLCDGVARGARIRPQGASLRRSSSSAPTAARLPNTTLFAVPGLKAETAVIAFDLEGVAVSSGAACSSGKVAALARAGRHGGPSWTWRAARCASASARPPPNPRSIGSWKLGIECREHYLSSRQGLAA